jgi:hypothetical protein
MASLRNEGCHIFLNLMAQKINVNGAGESITLGLTWMLGLYFLFSFLFFAFVIAIFFLSSLSKSG